MADITNPDELWNVIHAMQAEINELKLRPTSFDSAGQAMNSIDDLQYRAVDANGLLRMVMSASNMLDEIGVSAHFAGLAADGITPTIYIDADTGKLTAGAGAVWMDEDGISITAAGFLIGANAYKFVDDTGGLIGATYGFFSGTLNEIKFGIPSTSKHARASVSAVGAGQAEVYLAADTSRTGVPSLRVIQHSAGETYPGSWVQMDDVDFMAMEEVATDPSYIDNYMQLYYKDTGEVKIRHKQGATETEIILGSASAMDYDQLHAEIG